MTAWSYMLPVDGHPGRPLPQSTRSGHFNLTASRKQVTGGRRHVLVHDKNEGPLFMIDIYRYCLT